MACRQRIGYLSEESAYTIHSDLPITESLEFQSHFFEVWDWDWCRHLIDKMRVAPDKTLGDMSKGERRKAELLLALAHKPDLLILDDPAVGLDVTVRRDILWVTLEAAKQEGKTIIFTSHILQDVERVVDDILILDQGKVRLAGQMEDLKARTKRLVLAGVDGMDPLPGEISRKQLGRDLVLVTDQFTPKLEADLHERCPGLQVEDMNLEDIFCEVIGDQDQEA